MEYEVLARRYRPRRFEEVVGQESIAETLRGAIVQGRVGHAYLFTGPRGVGKTSMARIFAKALNCQKAAATSPSEADWAEKIAELPCNECSTCEDIHVGQDIDVVEMDGASHRGIEDVRSIVESVNRPATRSPYKIFIIDEVHMLTREAFNALLKTLEEPPAHVKFIFATTEPHRVPETVLSRCQRFDFHPINDDAITRRLRQILEHEKREAEDGLLEKIAKYGRGGLRDAQTLLDQILTFSEGRLCSEDLERITGRMPSDVIASLVRAVVEGDTRAVLAGLRTCSEKGADPAVLLEQVIENLRAEVHPLVLESDATDRSAGPALDRLLGALQILLEAASRLRHSALPVVAVEVVLLKVARLEDPLLLEEILEKLTAIEESGAASRADGGRAHLTRGRTGPPAGPTGDRGGAGARRDVASGGGPSAGASGALSGGAGDPRRVPSEERADHPQATESGLGVPPRGPRLAARAAEPASEGPAVAVASAVDQDVSGGEQERLTRDAEARDGAAADRTNEERVVSATLSLERLLSLWEQIRIELQEKAPHIAPLVGDAQPTLHPERADTARLVFDDDFFLARMKAPQNRRAFESLVADVTGQPWKFDLAKSARGAEHQQEGRAQAAAAGRVPSGASPEGPGGRVRAAEPGAPTGPRGVSTNPSSPTLASSEVVEKARKLFNGRIV